MMRKTYTRSIEDRLKIAERSRKRWLNPEYREMMSRKIKDNHISWNRGKKMKELGFKEWGFPKRLRSMEWEQRRIEAVKFSKKGTKSSIATIEKLRESHRGPSHYRWQNKTPLKFRIRRLKEYEIWKNKVKERDNFECIKCKSKEKLQVDHIIAFAVLLDEFLEIYFQFSQHEDKETLVRLAINWNKFWDISNGRTLCWKCHLNR